MNDPRPIPTVGVHYDVPASVYFSWDAVNASLLKRIAKSAKHARYEMDNPKAPTPAMLLGSCCHTALFEPDALATRYVVANDCEALLGSGPNKGQRCGASGRVLASGHWYCGRHCGGMTPDAMPKAFDEEGGEIAIDAVVTLDQLAIAKSVATSVRSDLAARELLNACRKEVCIVWIDPVTGILCKARLDGFDERGQRIIDLKTTDDASDDEFSDTIGKRNYDIQVAMYLDAATSITGELWEAFYFIACETSPPFVQAVTKCHQEVAALGRHRYRRLLLDYKWCIENQMFPGYHDHQITPISVTRFHFQKESRK